MAVVELTQDNFREIYSKNDIVVVDFWAPWCGPCRQFGPVFEATAEKFNDVVFGKINTEDQAELAGHFQVRSIPTLMIIREGIEVFYQAGATDEGTLIMLVNKAKELDMDEVKKKVAKEDAKSST